MHIFLVDSQVTSPLVIAIQSLCFNDNVKFLLSEKLKIGFDYFLQNTTLPWVKYQDGDTYIIFSN